MDNSTQCSILWSIALLPPQEMLPPASLFHTRSCANTESANIEHLFGFTSCSPSLYTENSTIESSESDMTIVEDVDSIYEAYEDFQRFLVVEEHTLSL